LGVSAAQLLRQAALRWPERTFVVDVGDAGDARREASFAQIDERAASVAARLREGGVEAGERVALIAQNSDAFIAAWFGVLYAGAAVVPIPILSAAPEVAHRIRHARCRKVIVDGARRALVDEACTTLAGDISRLDIDDVSQPTPDALTPPRDVAPNAPALILYTSGTTGTAKGAIVSHASLVTHTAGLVHHTIGLNEDDRVLGALPLTHSFGCRMVMLVSAFAGARCVLLPRFDAKRTLALLRDEAITWLPAVPTMYAAWAQVEGKPETPHLRWSMSAGAPLPDELARRAEARLGVEVRQGYGMTEATFSTINAPPDARTIGSVGRPVWGVEVRIADEAGNDVATGQEGEVLVRGTNAMSGYLDDTEATRQVAGDGWIRSGDIGRLDDAGRLWIVERLKDLIIRGGHNVYPAEVEKALAEHADIAQIAVLGRPDDYYGEEVVAVVVPRADATLDAQSLQTWARTRLARTKVPREYAFVTELPLGPSGKVLKRELRARLHQGTLQAHKPGD
jgi:long-chain acyl-CoA synthetase